MRRHYAEAHPGHEVPEDGMYCPPTEHEESPQLPPLPPPFPIGQMIPLADIRARMAGLGLTACSNHEPGICTTGSYCIESNVVVGEEPNASISQDETE
jgi:hypothetical protein